MVFGCLILVQVLMTQISLHVLMNEDVAVLGDILLTGVVVQILKDSALADLHVLPDLLGNIFFWLGVEQYALI